MNDINFPIYCHTHHHPACIVPVYAEGYALATLSDNTIMFFGKCEDCCKRESLYILQSKIKGRDLVPYDSSKHYEILLEISKGDWVNMSEFNTSKSKTELTLCRRMR